MRGRGQITVFLVLQKLNIVYLTKKYQILIRLVKFRQHGFLAVDHIFTEVSENHNHNIGKL